MIFIGELIYIIGSIVRPMVSLEQEVRQTANGMPLDAIAYKAPVFADGLYSYRVTDRQSGKRWWLLYMKSPNGNDGNWVVMPLEKGE